MPVLLRGVKMVLWEYPEWLLPGEVHSAVIKDFVKFIEDNTVSVYEIPDMDEGLDRTIAAIAQKQFKQPDFFEFILFDSTTLDSVSIKKNKYKAQQTMTSSISSTTIYTN
jgi:hypothetical protein